MLTRRRFLATAGAAGAFAGLRVALGADVKTDLGTCIRSPFGPLQPDPNRALIPRR